MKPIPSILLSLSLLTSLNIKSIYANEINLAAGISMERAKLIALEQVKGTIVSARTEKDDGITKYEIIIKSKNVWYEVEIDKATGKVLEVEKEGASNDSGHDDDENEDDD
jgi:hypothetical protein